MGHNMGLIVTKTKPITHSMGYLLAAVHSNLLAVKPESHPLLRIFPCMIFKCYCKSVMKFLLFMTSSLAQNALGMSVILNDY